MVMPLDLFSLFWHRDLTFYRPSCQFPLGGGVRIQYRNTAFDQSLNQETMLPKYGRTFREENRQQKSYAAVVVTAGVVFVLWSR